MSVSRITAFAAYSRTSLFSYSEYNNEKINVYNYPSFSIQSTFTLSKIYFLK